MTRRKIKSDTDQRLFSLVYHDFLKSIKAGILDNHYQVIIYIYLKMFTDSKNQCYPSVKTLSKLTKIGITKIKTTLAELEKKGIITKENRTRSDNGKSSNLYTLHDNAEMWKAENMEELKTAVDGIEEKHMIELLTAKGYYISKEKGLASDSDQTTDTSTKTNSSNLDKDNTDKEKSQPAERYTMQDIKSLYNYDILMADHPGRKTDIDIVFDILYDTLNSTKPTIRIAGEDKPAMVVIGKLMKLEHPDLIYSIEKFHQQANRIKNVKAYMLTILYNAKEQSHLDTMNLGHYNGDF